MISIESDERKVLKMMITSWFCLPEIRSRLYVLRRKMLMTNANMTYACNFPNPRSFAMLDITVEVLGTSYLNMTYQFNLRDKIIVLSSH